VSPRSTGTVLHTGAGENGLREVATRPTVSIATHNFAEGHDTDANEKVEVACG
jgi:hypothetical protein